MHSKITSKFQATIPSVVRKRLKIRAGDLVFFEIREDGAVIIKKFPHPQSEEYAYLKAVESTMSEWNSKEDDECFKDLQNI